MAKNALLSEVNAKIRTEKEDAERHRENPRLISLMNHLIRLTNSDEDNAAIDEENNRAPKCPHEIVNRITGKCMACHEEVVD